MKILCLDGRNYIFFNSSGRINFLVARLQELSRLCHDAFSMPTLVTKAENDDIEDVKVELIRKKSASILQHCLTWSQGMQKCTFDRIEYNTEDVSGNGGARLTGRRFLDCQMRKIKEEIAVYCMAKSSYIAGLKSELQKAGSSGAAPKVEG